MVTNWLSFFVLLLTISTCSFAQELTYTGRVVDNSSQEGVPGASVLLRNRTKILSFVRTSSAGDFLLKFSGAAGRDSLYLEVSHMAYEKSHFQIQPETRYYTLSIEPKSINLEAIKVGKVPAVRAQGDTLIYNVGSFRDSLDRSIADVIRKMPGMEVKEDGKILYNGKGISDFYIDGDDLMGNRYGVGAKAIPHKAILSVEVYRNHQKIKALRDKLESDEVAVNLVVKDEAKMKLLGSGEAAGNVVKNYYLDANLMLFNKKIKSLNALMLNNVGYDIQYGLQDLVNQPIGDFENYTLQGSMKSVDDNNIEDTYENRGIGFSTNQHFSIAKGWKARLNAALSVEKGKEAVQSLLQYLTTENLQDITESSDIESKPLGFMSNLNLVKNTEREYVDILFDFSYRNREVKDANQGMDYFMANALDQQKKMFKGRMDYIPNTKGKSIWRFKLRSDYGSNNENLAISSDGFIAAMLPYADISQISQSFQRDYFDINGHISLRPMSKSIIQQSYAIEQGFKQDNLRADLFDNGEATNDVFLMFDNTASLKRLKTEVSGRFILNKGNLRSMLSLPVGLQKLWIHTKSDQVSDCLTNLLFEPVLTTNYLFNGYHGVKLDVSRRQDFGTVKDVYTGRVLVNPRSVESRVGFVPYQYSVNTLVEYNVQNPLSLLFVKLGYLYAFGRQNYTYRTDYDPSETIALGVAERSNNFVRQEINLYVSKFIFPLRASSALKLISKWNTNNIFFNEQLLSATSSALELIPSFNGKIGNILDWSYDAVFGRQRNKLPEHQMADNFYYFSNDIKVTCKVASRMYLTIGDRINTLRNKQSRLDFNNLHARVTYRLNNKIIDRVELRGSNLLDQRWKGFVMQGVNSFFRQDVRYRGRMFLIGASFNLN